MAEWDSDTDRSPEPACLTPSDLLAQRKIYLWFTSLRMAKGAKVMLEAVTAKSALPESAQPWFSWRESSDTLNCEFITLSLRPILRGMGSLVGFIGYPASGTWRLWHLYLLEGEWKSTRSSFKGGPFALSYRAAQGPCEPSFTSEEGPLMPLSHTRSDKDFPGYQLEGQWWPVQAS